MTEEQLENELLFSAQNWRQITLIINGVPVRIRVESWNIPQCTGIAVLWPPIIDKKMQEYTGNPYALCLHVRLAIGFGHLEFYKHPYEDGSDFTLRFPYNQIGLPL